MTVVVSRFNETLEWQNEYPFNQFNYVVYNKGANSDFVRTRVKQVIALPNVGRCDHTYMHHIVANYATLQGVLIFFPGSIDIYFKKEKASLIQRYVLAKRRALMVGNARGNMRAKYNDFTLDQWQCIHPLNARANPESALTPCTIRPFGKWYDAHFGAAPADFLSLHGIFSVAARDVKQHPVARYMALLRELSVSSNPEVGHYMERAWAGVFSPLRHTTKTILK